MAQNKLSVQSSGSGSAATQPGAVCDVRLEVRKLRPLVPISFCSILFDKEFDAVAADCESGFFRFSFDISSRMGGRRELRILRDCVLHRLNPNYPEPKSLPDVFDLLLPKRDIRSTELARVLACEKNHVHKLKSNFVITRGPLQADGPNSFSVFSRASIVKFLRLRAGGDPSAN